MKRPFISLFLLLAACQADLEATTGDDAELKAVPFVAVAAPIEPSDMPSTLSQAFLRGTHTLATAEWTAKWQASLADPVLFFRAFPGGFHKDLKALPSKKRLGREGLCVGDAHPGNFGFLRLGGKTRFVYNDLDDAGFCPVGHDAARYFAALRVFFDDADLTAEVLETYVDTVKDANRAEPLDSDWHPDWEEVREDGVDEATKSDKFKLGGEVKAVAASVRTSVAKAASSVSWLAGWQVLDVVEIDRLSGGSGGLDRYWALVEKAKVRTIVEFKQTARAGVEHGLHGQVLSSAKRLPTLKADIWGYSGADGLSSVTLFSKAFVVRDRLQRKAVDVLKLAGKDREQVLKAQASVLAALHRPAWSGVEKDELRAWLKGSAKSLAGRWATAYEGLGGN